MNKSRQHRTVANSEHATIAIAGAGPVGMVAALGLGRRGIDVLVLEAGPALSSESRASTFHPPTLDMLDELGVADALIRSGLRVPTFQYRDRHAGLVAEFDLSVLSRDTHHPYRIQCEQSKLTRIIHRALERLPEVTVRFNAQVVAAETHQDHVTTHLADGSVVESKYLVGADGANSAVRRHLSIDFTGETYPERYLVISTKNEIKDLLQDISYVNYISDPQEWLVLLRTPEHWRAMFPADPKLSSEAICAAEAVQHRMRTIADLGHDWSILHTTLYRVHQRVAATYRVDRILLAGDAAHVNNPLGGLGMNSGIHDAYTLLPILSDALERSANPEALDAYAGPRRQVSLEYVSREADRNWRRIRERDEAERQRHQAELRSIAADPVRHLSHVRQACMLTPVARVRR